MRGTVLGLSVTSIVFSGAIFGFFYAWVCSTMWGLDRADPRVAIAAMQAMNASVRNAVFFPAFFLTPVILGLTVAATHFSGRGAAAFWFCAAAAIYLVFGLMLTLMVNVPMNEALAATAVPPTSRRRGISGGTIRRDGRSGTRRGRWLPE
ncbi:MULTISPECIES: anthrone oxygenase family protein [Rhizobium]|uniref:anthrone oxygenase family protein n=1 Tax=Rhizobium TaxID=379 RepID=UPI0035E4050B